MARTIATVVGARPQFIKAAPLSRALACSADLTEVMVHTGQHFDDGMSTVFFEDLNVPKPAYNLGINGGGHGDMTGRMLVALEHVFEREKPDVVVVYGDTNSTLAGALAAAKLQLPVAHVEAGLRSFDRTMPEEINRVLADHVSDLLLCPTKTAIENLRGEGITDGVHHAGDVMYDATLYARHVARRSSDIMTRLDLEKGRYAVATVHRAENTDSPDKLDAVLDYLRAEALERPIIFPVHPRTRAAARRFGLSFDGLLTIDPIGYLDMAQLLDSAAVLYTDSGGLQKEAYFYRRACVTLRSETEWVETIEAGWNRLWHGPDYVAPRCDILDYGDGHAADRVVELIRDYLNGRSR